jgi:hypothetical protein
MQDNSPDLQQPPLFSPHAIKILKLSIVVMTSLIAAGLVALVIGMKQQADKLIAKNASQTRIYSYQLSEGARYRSVHIGADGQIWVEGIFPDGRIELIEVDKQGAAGQHIILEPGN